MADAIRAHARDGMSIVMGTCMEQKIPFAAGHELIRQGRKDLTLVGPISDILFDQLVGAGCVARVMAAWVGNVMMGSAYNFRRAVEEKIPHPVEVIDYSNFTIALALHAGGLGIPYMPTRTILGSDIAKRNPFYKTHSSPFNPSDTLGAIAALTPDLGIFHVQRADANGSCHIWGDLAVTADAARSAKTVIVVAEEIVDTAVIESDPNRTVIPGFLVSAVVHAPFGSHPSPTQGYVSRDHRHYTDYHRETKTREGFLRWLDTWVMNVSDRVAYCRLLGAERVKSLGVNELHPATPTEFGY